MTAFWFWVFVAIAFAIAEIMTVALFALFITIGALGAAIVALLGFGLLVQAIVLGVLGRTWSSACTLAAHRCAPAPTAWSASRRC